MVNIGYPRWQFDNFISVNGVACNSILGEPARDQCCMLIETVWQRYGIDNFMQPLFFLVPFVENFMSNRTSTCAFRY